MAELKQQHIILGITGGIAAYKAALLTRLFIAEQAHVRICMTPSATEFISPMTLQALSGHPVHSHLLNENAEAAMGHIELARWADVVLIAPATANTLAKIATGQADNLLTTLCLATSAPIMIAPAMNQAMWHNTFTQQNIQRLQQHQIAILGPDKGSQACGDQGLGRMLEPEAIVQQVKQILIQTQTQPAKPLNNIHVMITAGPTREAIDPVRYISNRSSGKMGYAIAAAAQQLGATVTLVSGPVALDCPHGITRYWAESANDMYQQVQQHIADMHIFIATAAVADYAPQSPATRKIKKNDTQLTLTLQKNVDILQQISHDYPSLFTVGFAAETDDVESYARSKLINKKLNMIAANQVGNDKGFEVDHNALLVIWQDGKKSLPLTTKTALAQQLMQLITHHFRNSPSHDTHTL